MSPGDRSYDAIGLMKQINEQTAAQYASAHAILGNETPKALPRGKSRNDGDEDRDDIDPNNQHGDHSQSASSALVKFNLFLSYPIRQHFIFIFLMLKHILIYIFAIWQENHTQHIFRIWIS